LVAAHFFAFGGSLKIAPWMRRLIDAAFDCDDDGHKLLPSG